jgi:hypothetical protein
MNTPCPCNLLRLYPRFAADSWNFAESCKLRGIVTLNARAEA